MRFRHYVRALTLATAASLIVATAAVHAQTETPAPVRHIVDSAAVQAAVASKVAAEAADRDAVRTAVHQPEAQRVAERLGLTPTRVDDAVQTMSASEAAALAPTARMANDAQAGGDITISVTVLLLLLILVVLLVR